MLLLFYFAYLVLTTLGLFVFVKNSCSTTVTTDELCRQPHYCTLVAGGVYGVCVGTDGRQPVELSLLIATLDVENKFVVDWPDWSSRCLFMDHGAGGSRQTS